AVQSSGLSSPGQRRFWHAFPAFSGRNPQRGPAPSAFSALLRKTKDQATAPPARSITLGGARPPASPLLTLRAVRALQSADIILIDDSLGPDILSFARREAKTVLVGKTGPSQQDEVTLMIALAKAGRRVVRLKGGGSPTFGHEEIAACRSAGIAVEVVPGVTEGGARGESESSRVKRVSGRGKELRLDAAIPGKPLYACREWAPTRL